MVDVLMPLCDGQAVDERVVKAIYAQDVPTTLRIVSRPKEPNRFKGAANNRNRLMRHVENEFVLFIDSDVVLRQVDDIRACISILKRYPEYDAVAIDTKGVDVAASEAHNHVCVACVCMRKETLSKFKWRVPGNYVCECQAFFQDLNVRYLRSRKVKEVTI